MIKLEEWDLNLIRRIEKKNYKDYKVRTIEGEDYIRKDDLISLIEDLEDNRDYAEEKVEELTAKYDELEHEKVGGLQYTATKTLNKTLEENDKLKKEVKEFKETIDNIRNTLNEDDYDKLYEEGIEI